MRIKTTIKGMASRMLLAIFTAPFSLNSDGLPTPDCYQIFLAGNIPEHEKNKLVKCYQEIFSEEPWLENWSEDDVLKKIQNDLSDDPMSFLVTYSKNETVQGFAWGTIIAGHNIVHRASTALNINVEQINLKISAQNKVLYCDEFAIRKNARRGVDPVRNILKKFLLYAYTNGVTATIFWSTPNSKIVPLAQYMGYKLCGDTIINGKVIVFLFNKDFRSLLKATKHLSSSWAEVIMAFYNKRSKKNKNS